MLTEEKIQRFRVPPPANRLSTRMVIGGQPPHRLAAEGAVAGAQLSGRLAFCAAIAEVFDRVARVVVTLQGGVLPAGRRVGGIGRVLGFVHGLASKNVGWLGLVSARVLDSCSDFCLDQCRISVRLCRIMSD